MKQGPPPRRLERLSRTKSDGSKLLARWPARWWTRAATQNGAFNVGDDNAECGVKGHAVIVHKGCPASEPNCNDGGARIGCCVLA